METCQRKSRSQSCALSAHHAGRCRFPREPRRAIEVHVTWQEFHSMVPATGKVQHWDESKLPEDEARQVRTARHDGVVTMLVPHAEPPDVRITEIVILDRD